MVVKKENKYSISALGVEYSFTLETGRESFKTNLFQSYSDEWFELQQKCRDLVKFKIMEEKQCK